MGTVVNKFAHESNEKPFQTFGDPALIRMLTATVRFVNDMAAKKEPRWLSLLVAAASARLGWRALSGNGNPIVGACPIR